MRINSVLAMLACGLIAGGNRTIAQDTTRNSEGDAKPTAGPSARSFVIGEAGRTATYSLSSDDAPAGSSVKTFSLALGEMETIDGVARQWVHLESTKTDGKQFGIWLLSAEFPSTSINRSRTAIARYIFQEGSATPLDYRDRMTGRAVLPSIGGWPHLFPRAPEEGKDGVLSEVFPEVALYLGHRYRRDGVDEGEVPVPPSDARIVRLLPDMLVGVPHATRQKDETRRYDDSEYDYIPLTRNDLREMIDAGLTCFPAKPDQVEWFDRSEVFHYGVSGGDVAFPECLYKSQYLGPALFIDEPAVVTRDRVLRPRLRVDEAFRRAISPQLAMTAFEEHFENAVLDGAPSRLMKSLAARSDVDLGAMNFLQENIFSWETMISSAAYELSYNAAAPSAIVFEPPSQVGTRRTLPGINMSYGCQIPVDHPNHLIDVIIGYLRGAARLTGKNWGISIYGEVNRSDAFGFLTRAYDKGATRFFFWDTHRLAAVPYAEVLGLTRNLSAHAVNHPPRNLETLRNAAQVAILLPPGYNLGHVYMGKGLLWGVGELNLERINRESVKYRVVMGNFFTEIERCLRMGEDFDLLWDLPGIVPEGYREIVRVREDGKVEVLRGSDRTLLDHARTPRRTEGEAPELSVRLSTTQGDLPLDVTATAHVVQGSAPVYYTLGRDSSGVYRNTRVAWELYGPNKEDYRFLRASSSPSPSGEGGHVVETSFRLVKPGKYRLRIATADLAGRTSVLWKSIKVSE